MQTLEEVLAKVDATIADDTVIAIEGVIGINKIEYGDLTNFFLGFNKEGFNKYRITRTRMKDGELHESIATEFYSEKYLQPILDRLNSNPIALAKHRSKEPFKLFAGPGDTAFQDRLADVDIKVDIVWDTKEVMLQRSDTHAIKKFNDIDELISTVFTDNNMYSLALQEKIAKGLMDKGISLDKAVKAAESRLKTTKAHSEIFSGIISKIPADIRLLLEVK